MVETDVRYYRRRACEEMGAARRAVTEAARERRLQLVDLYLQRLAELKAPNPFDGHEFDRAHGPATTKGRAAVSWPGVVTDTRL